MLGALLAPTGSWALGPYCRLDRTPWLGCAARTGQASGTACSCPTSTGKAAGRVSPADKEVALEFSSDSTKVALGITELSGPVTVFVPSDLTSGRAEAHTPEQQRLVQIWTFYSSRNLAPRTPNLASSGNAPSEASAQAVPPSPAPAPPPPTPYYHRAHRPSTAPLTPARAFSAAKDIPPPGLGAYGIVALKAKPTPASGERLGMLCRAFLASLPAQSSLPASIPLADQMVTFWPLEEDAPPGTADCPAVLDHYDLWGGQSAIHDAIAQGKDLSGRGPFLIGWSPSESRLRPDAVVLVVDMSDFTTQASFDEAFLFWQRKVVEDPSLWRSGFSIERIRLAMRDFADHYGSDILKAIHLGGG